AARPRRDGGDLQVAALRQRPGVGARARGAVGARPAEEERAQAAGADRGDAAAAARAAAGGNQLRRAVLRFRSGEAMVVGVIDVGANTVRLPVSRGKESLLGERVMLRLGEAIERSGRIPDEKLDETAEVVARFAAAARRYGVQRFEVLVTSPGRQAAHRAEPGAPPPP